MNEQTEKPKALRPPAGNSPDRQDRLAARLRENLLKRKQQARQREQAGEKARTDET